MGPRNILRVNCGIIGIDIDYDSVVESIIR